MVEKPTTKPAYKYMVKAATTEGYNVTYYTNDPTNAETWAHVMARKLRHANEGKRNVDLVIDIHDISKGREKEQKKDTIIAHYYKNTDGEQFKVFRPDTFMLLPEAGKEIYDEQ